MIAICVDGASPDYVLPHDLLRFSNAADRAGRLRSVYPSSTAPAHASMLTGRHPMAHGIVGNRYWLNDQRDVIARSKGDPLSCLHPYERRSLMAPSVIDTLCQRGLRIAAIHFPHTFSVDRQDDVVESVYTLYAPSRREEVAWTIDGDRRRAAVRISHFDLDFEVMVEAPIELGDGSLRFHSPDPRVTLSCGARSADVHCIEGRRALSLRLAVAGADARSVRIVRSTAALVLTFGQLRADAIVRPGQSPHSNIIDYSANPGHEFYEVPNVAWTTQVALDALDRDPDVLLLRYPQVDHAQEYLHWYAVKGTPEERGRSRAQIVATYRAVEEGIRRVIQRAGQGVCSFIVSDHGIDYVDLHFHVNSVLTRLGLDEELVFQGDSTCAFLYGSRRPSERELQAIADELQRAHPLLRVASPRELKGLHVYREDRCGIMAILCGEHAEIQYGPGELVTPARSASHGFPPNSSAMDGVWIPIAGAPAGFDAPRSVTDLGGILATLTT